MKPKIVHQDINLYQPDFRAEDKVFSAMAIAMNLGALTAGLLVITLVTWWHVASVEREIARLGTQDAGHERLIAEGKLLLEKAGSPEEQQARLRALAIELDRRQLALRSLDHSEGAMALGFAARMEALAHQHVDGLWVTGATFTAASHGFALTGSAVTADLVPLYLQALATEPALKGTRLDRLEIERQKGSAAGHVDFAVSSSESLMPKDGRLAMAAARAGQ